MIQTEHKSEHMPNTRANTHLAGVSPIGEHIANTPERRPHLWQRSIRAYASKTS
jgi:hypothetical protein